MRLLYVFIAILAMMMATVPVNGANPDFRVSLGDTGIQKLLTGVMNKVNAWFAAGNHIPVPDFNYDGPKIALTLGNTFIFGVDIPAFVLKVTNPEKLSLTASFTVNIDTLIHWKEHHFPFLRDHIHLTADTTLAYLGFDVNVMVNQQGQPVFSLIDVNTDVGELALHFNGHWDAFIYDLVKNLFKKEIRNAINTALHGAVNTALTNAFGQITQNYVINRKITSADGKWSTVIDTALTDIEISDNNFLSFASAMQLTDVNTNKPCPYEFAGTIPSYDVNHNNSQVQLFVGDTTLTCLFWSPFLADDIQHVIHGNTKNWALIIPAISIAYPDTNMTNTLKAVSIPRFSIDPTTGLTVNFNGEFDLALTDTPTAANTSSLCTLGLNLTVGIDVSLSANQTIHGINIKLQLTDLDIELSVMNSNIGPISVSGIQSLINYLEPVVESLLNQILGRGLPISIPGSMLLEQISVDNFADYFEFSAEINLDG